jgi:hypothetical protein
MSKAVGMFMLLLISMWRWNVLKVTINIMLNNMDYRWHAFQTLELEAFAYFNFFGSAFKWNAANAFSFCMVCSLTNVLWCALLLDVFRMLERVSYSLTSPQFSNFNLKGSSMILCGIQWWRLVIDWNYFFYEMHMVCFFFFFPLYHLYFLFSCNKFQLYDS